MRSWSLPEHPREWVGHGESSYDRGFRVFGSVRKAADADRLRTSLARIHALVFGVTDEAAVWRAAREVRSALNGTKRWQGS